MLEKSPGFISAHGALMVALEALKGLTTTLEGLFCVGFLPYSRLGESSSGGESDSAIEPSRQAPAERPLIRWQPIPAIS